MDYKLMFWCAVWYFIGATQEKYDRLFYFGSDQMSADRAWISICFSKKGQ